MGFLSIYNEQPGGGTKSCAGSPGQVRVVGRGLPEPYVLTYVYISFSTLLNDALLMIPRILQRMAIGRLV